jgi:integrase
MPRFFGFLRCAEFTELSMLADDKKRHLSRDDVDILTPPTIQSVSVLIKSSKTDQFGKGVLIFLSRTSAPLCPVSALLGYLSTSSSDPGPLFLRSNDQPLSRAYLVTQVHSALKEAGLNVQHFNGHSFRIGAATTALQSGISDAKIKLLGRWESSAYQLYLHSPREEVRSICSSLARANC